MATDALGVEILEPNSCWELLRANDVGRLAVAITDHPDIFPINYIVERGTVVFRTAEGTMFRSDPGPQIDSIVDVPVVFEADMIDDRTRSGWTVVVRGIARDHSDDLAGIGQAACRPVDLGGSLAR